VCCWWWAWAKFSSRNIQDGEADTGLTTAGWVLVRAQRRTTNISQQYLHLGELNMEFLLWSCYCLFSLVEISFSIFSELAQVKMLLRKTKQGLGPGRILWINDPEPRRRWVDNTGMGLGEAGWGDVDWIGLAQYANRWRALVNSALNLRVPKMLRNYRAA
jgi:hypothetical protein